MKQVNPFATKRGQNEFQSAPDFGLVSQISFQNEDFWKGMQTAFGLRKGEEIIGIVVGNDGIKARFRLRNVK